MLLGCVSFIEGLMFVIVMKKSHMKKEACKANKNLTKDFQNILH